jgi:hypothetical protein
MGIESYFLITIGVIGILVSVVLVKMGYAKPMIGALSRSARRAINVTRKFCRHK